MGKQLLILVLLVGVTACPLHCAANAQPAARTGDSARGCRCCHCQPERCKPTLPSRSSDKCANCICGGALVAGHVVIADDDSSVSRWDLPTVCDVISVRSHSAERCVSHENRSVFFEPHGCALRIALHSWQI